MQQQRRGDWMQTFTGRAYWPMDPRASDVDIEDIAHHLSMLCRYNGACTRFYSVAEHSVVVSHLVPEEHAFKALMHDATEAYCTDVIRPVKRFLPEFKAIEDANWAVIMERFGCDASMPDAVHEADAAALYVEANALMGRPPMSWNLPAPRIDTSKISLRCLSPHEAKHAFLSRFNELNTLEVPRWLLCRA